MEVGVGVGSELVAHCLEKCPTPIPMQGLMDGAPGYFTTSSHTSDSDLLSFSLLEAGEHPCEATSSAQTNALHVM